MNYYLNKKNMNNQKSNLKTKADEFFETYNDFEKDVKDEIIKELNKWPSSHKVIFKEQTTLIASGHELITGISKKPGRTLIIIENGIGADTETSLHSDIFNILDYIWILKQILENE
jgi:hypothetical protein